MTAAFLAALLWTAPTARANPGLPASDLLETGQSLLAAKRYDELAKSLSGTALQKMKPRDLRRAYDLLGQSYEGLDQMDRALEVYQLGATLFPKDINLLSRLAGLLHRVGLDEQARPYFERILLIHANNAGAHLGLAEAQAKLGFLDRAVEHYEIVLKEWRDQPSIWRDYSEVLGRKRDFAAAVSAVREALKLSPSDPDALLDLARFQYGSRQTAEALESLGRAAAAAPGRRDIPLQEALWRLDAGELDRAAGLAESVLRRSPAEPLALWIRGSASLRRGRAREAAADLERAAAQKDQPFTAAAAQAMLRALREP